MVLVLEFRENVNREITFRDVIVAPTKVTLLMVRVSLCNGLFSIPSRRRWLTSCWFSILSRSIFFSAEVGDYEPEIHTAAFVSEFRFVPNQNEQFEIDVLEQFKKFRSGFLACWLPPPPSLIV